MIRVVYDGNLGNNLFQYCFGRILAERLNYKLIAKPIAGFPRTFDQVEGLVYDSGDPKILRGQKPDLRFLAEGDPKCPLILTGYFQRYEYYQPYAEKIKCWLSIDRNIEDVAIQQDDVLVGIRRGKDYIPRHGLPLSYYEGALEQMKYNRVFICTDSPRDPFVRYIARKFSGSVRAPGALDNLTFIKRFRKIIISNSTFLWWGAFLSDAEEIVYPRPANGFWSPVEPLSKNIDLEVSESRYRYRECERYRSEFISEIVENHMDNASAKLKACVRPFIQRRRIASKDRAGYLFQEE